MIKRWPIRSLGIMETKHKKALKAKDIVTLEALQIMHPANRTAEQEAEMVKLQQRRAAYGE